jgi:uncharacterized protein (DUF1015 family)
MADVRPLRAVHYDWQQISNPADVVAPPYDVIDDAHQAALYDRHPHNIIRLILNRLPADGPNNRYDDAARTYQQWLAEGVLVRDDQEALHVYHQRFTIDLPDPDTGALRPTPTLRRGFMGRVRLHPYEDQVVLPHEQTLRGPKIDRLRLNEAVGANLSQIFMLYDDPTLAVDALLDAAIASLPCLDIHTDDGIQHMIWAVTDPAVIAQVQALLAPQALLIADGHHRYETNLAMRDRAIEAEGDLSLDDPRRFVFTFLANAADPGLLVLPTHRVVHSLPSFSPDALFAQLKDRFEVEPMPGASLSALQAAVTARQADDFAFGLILKGSSDGIPCVLYRSRQAPTLVPDLPGPDALKKLDLTILHEVILKDLLGMTEDDFSQKRYLRYEKSLHDLDASLRQPDAQAAFLVNHSPVEQVREVCVSGGKMPQKSTFFYPKVFSGIIINPLR